MEVLDIFVFVMMFVVVVVLVPVKVLQGLESVVRFQVVQSVECSEESEVLAVVEVLEV